jgi:hypothetical protein
VRLASMGSEVVLELRRDQVLSGGAAGQLHARTRVLPKPRDGGFSL